MHFVVTCIDKPDHAQLRMDTRSAHIDYLSQFEQHVVMAGPLLSDDESAMVGSMLIIDMPDRQQLDQFLANDPYQQAGLFDQVTVAKWRKTLPAA